MKSLFLTLPTPAENLALDEALLATAEAAAEGDSHEGEVLRLWESPAPMVVLGRGSRVDEEVNLSYCKSQGIPVLRRCSGGATIVTGPGCLMYAVVLSMERRPAVRGITGAHAYVLNRVARAVTTRQAAVFHAGTSDLVVAESADAFPSTWRKVSGNSMRRGRRYILYHGTLLCAFDLALVAKCLGYPPRIPEYRASRAHEEFIANLGVARHVLQERLASEWHVEGELASYPRATTSKIMVERYEQGDWAIA